METPAVAELLKKLLKLQQTQDELNEEMSRLKLSAELRKRSHRPPRRNTGDRAPPWRKTCAAEGSRVHGSMNSARMFTNKQYLNILQSMSQSVHVLDRNDEIIFWSPMSEKLYGYSAAEVIGQNPLNVLVDEKDVPFALTVARRCCDKGEIWTGEFPIKNKSGRIIPAICTCSAFHDDTGSLIGIITITTLYQNPTISLAKLNPQDGESSSIPARNSFASKGAFISELGHESDQPIRVFVASKISDCAAKVSNKVRSKMRASVNTATLSKGGSDDRHHSDHVVFGPTLSDHEDDAASYVATTPRGEFFQSPFGIFTHNDEKFPLKPIRDLDDDGYGYGNSAMRKVLTSKAQQWEVKEEGLLPPWEVDEQESSNGRPTHSEWTWGQNGQEKEKYHQIKPTSYVKFESHNYESNKPINTDASSLWSSSTDTNSTSNVSNCRTSSSSSFDEERELGYEISWDDLTIGEEIGQGSCGTVFRGLWFGCDVAVKVFSKQEYSEEVIQSFRQEVSLMKRFRHPNVLLFMGAVTTPQRLCIVSEFVPRGSLFRLLQRTMTKLDWRRRIQMALDIARGMNYLHCCSPPIIHRDLKSSNILVDRNCTVKVADFGLSRIKHETYLTTKSGIGTPQWMAPEVLRNESADEKSDIYSFGVILWELATQKIPWETLNSMQVVGTVGFMNQRLEIPKDIDPLWISLIESCWHSDAKLRPTFQELIEKLRDMQREYAIQFQATRAMLLDQPSPR